MQNNEELKEYLAYEIMCVDDKVKKYANKIGLIPENHYGDLKSAAQEFIDFYEGSTPYQKELIKNAIDFYFCVGIIGYYFSDKPETDNFKNFFYLITEKEMTKENSYQIIKLSNGENAYWFIQTCEASNHHNS